MLGTQRGATARPIRGFATTPTQGRQTDSFATSLRGGHVRTTDDNREDEARLFENAIAINFSSKTRATIFSSSTLPASSGSPASLGEGATSGSIAQTDSWTLIQSSDPFSV